MGFLDNVSAFTKGVGAKAKGNYDVVALSTQVNGVKKEISALKSQLGEEYLRLHRDDAEEALAGYIKEIKEKENKIAELNAEIEATKEATAAVQFTAPVNSEEPDNYTGRRCSNCGKPISDDAVFCGNCGTKNEIIVPEPADEDTETVLAEIIEPEVKKCFKCGAELKKESAFCVNCGAKQE